MRFGVSTYMGAAAATFWTWAWVSEGSSSSILFLLALLVLLLGTRMHGWYFDTEIFLLDNLLCLATHLADGLGFGFRYLRIDDLASIQSVRKTQNGLLEGAWQREAMGADWKLDHWLVPQEGQEDLKIYVHRPRSLHAHPDKRLPLLVWFHGGGFVAGIAKDVALKGILAELAGEIVVASVEYRLAPEHPFPAAPQDAMAAVRWLSEHCEQLQCTPESISVGGLSAGGNLAAVVAQQGRLEGITFKSAIVLIPWMIHCGTAHMESHAKHARCAALPMETINWFYRCYVQNPEKDCVDPLCCPLYGDLKGLPLHVVCTNTADCLADEGLEYVAALRRAGVDVQHVSCTGTHTFGLMADKRAMAELQKGMRAALGLA